jgi:hypothetical protein
MRESKKVKYRGHQSEILESIVFEGYEIKSLKHGNTGHVLYRSPSKEYDWEDCWGMDLQTAKNNVLKHKQHLAESGSVPE